MSGFFEDEKGNKSSKRLLQFVSSISGIILAFFCVFMAFSNGKDDIGTNMVYLITGLVGLGVAGGVGVAMSNKGQKS